MIQYALKHPAILEVLGRVGHGDRIAVVDSNYPTHARRDPQVTFISLNITQGLVDTATLLSLIGASVPIERITYPQPSDEVNSGMARPVHRRFLEVRDETFPEAATEILSPEAFYEMTSDPRLAVMIASGEPSHFGSAVLTVGYLPEGSPDRV